MSAPSFREDPMSQLPAVELLVNLGWSYLTPAEALAERAGRKKSVLLEGVLRDRLAAINRFNYKGRTHAFSETGIESAIAALTEIGDNGLIPSNHRIFDLLCLGKSIEQVVDGGMVNPQLRYFDWDRIENNAFHVTEEFEVERHGSKETRRPDLVLFVNGIPLAVIECKSPLLGKKALPEAISQHLRNQKAGEIPHFFWYSQVLVALSRDEASYATTATVPEFWSEWKEERPNTAVIEALVNQALPPSVAEAIESVGNKIGRREAIVAREEHGRQVTEQDRLLHALCRPERLLELFRKFIVFDAGKKKIARYPQYFAIRKILQRVQQNGPDGRREGGVVWHTQGSGKSLTMVMLAKNLALHPAVAAPRILLVTDRVDLDKQIRDTFADCGLTDVKRAGSGKHLRELLRGRHEVITTLIDKFEGALQKEEQLDDDANIFVLVDESHRSQHGRQFSGQFGAMHAMMRKALPRACYLGFTGTPLMKREKNTARQFGGFIDTYSIDQAVADEAVLRLLYEGRLVDQDVDKKQIDAWFDRLTRKRTKEEKAALKRKFATAGHLHKAEQRMRLVSWDVSTHLEDRFKGTGLKGQLVADSRLSAIKYKQLLDEIGLVTSEVVISKSDEREDHTSASKLAETEIQQFWEEMMREHGSEESYKENLVTSFKGEGAPDLLIVCSKLLTGFDAPRNTVLYLDRTLRDHTLLQAIARVNRKFPGKDFGYIIDYRGILGELDQALATYSQLEGFDPQDLETALFSIESEIAKLADAHAALRSLFQKVRNRHDLDEYVDLLRNEAVRDEFVDRLRKFARTLEIALSSLDWIEKTPAATVAMYRDDLKFFENLRRYLRQIFSAEVDYQEYEAQMQKLIDRHVGSDEVRQLTPLVDIFDKEKFEAEVEKVATPAARADTIAHRTAKTITERMDQDPVFFERLSKVLRKVIEDYEAKRIAAAEYLKRAQSVSEEVLSHGIKNVPEPLRDRPPALAFFHTLRRAILGEEGESKPKVVEELTALSTHLDEVVARRVVVDWQNKPDVQNSIKNALEDALLEAFAESGREIALETIDFILDHILQAARHHYPR
ncbi:MAG: type I restriction endonuclease subunit R [Verrucomicrobiales bacterium]|nr:type I restriction endonuclease subunit R [Verrucomicrobiales bacterium]